MNKVIFIDVDGTLRNEDKQITSRTLKALKKVKKIGYEPILCTGRPRDYAEKLNNSIDGSQYIIYNNGAGIYDSLKKKVLYENPMNAKSILDLYKFANLDNVRFILACNGTRYVNKIKHNDGSEILFELPLEKFLQMNSVIAVTIASPDFNTIKEMKDKVSNVDGIKIINQSKSLVDENFPQIGTIYYDIVDNKSSKGDAVKHFLKLFNISKENSIAIGDDNNDISMFEECGYRVAMKNALPSLKKIADYITDDNNNDGVARFLENYILDNSNAD